MIPTEASSHPLSIALSAAVPLWIAEIRRKGGPDAEDMEACRRFSDELAEHGDLLQYRGGRPGQTADLFNNFAYCLAVMSFCPGGVRFAGNHWESGV